MNFRLSYRLLCTRYSYPLRSQNVPVIPVGPLGATPLSDAVDPTCKQGGGTQSSFISATPNCPDYKPGLKDSPSQGSRLTHPPHTSVAVQGRDKHAGCLACSAPLYLGPDLTRTSLISFAWRSIHSSSPNNSRYSKIGTFPLNVFPIEGSLPLHCTYAV